jgi:hypothetical protein
MAGSDKRLVVEEISMNESKKIAASIRIRLILIEDVIKEIDRMIER